jgi:hypothetical protein
MAPRLRVSVTLIAGAVAKASVLLTKSVLQRLEQMAVALVDKSFPLLDKFRISQEPGMLVDAKRWNVESSRA